MIITEKSFDFLHIWMLRADIHIQTCISMCLHVYYNLHVFYDVAVPCCFQVYEWISCVEKRKAARSADIVQIHKQWHSAWDCFALSMMCLNCWHVSRDGVYLHSVPRAESWACACVCMCLKSWGCVVCMFQEIHSISCVESCMCLHVSQKLRMSCLHFSRDAHVSSFSFLCQVCLCWVYVICMCLESWGCVVCMSSRSECVSSFSFLSSNLGVCQLTCLKRLRVSSWSSLS